MSSMLQIPVIGYLIPYDASKTWLEGRTITGKIQYRPELDEWVMVDKGTPNSVIVFVPGAPKVEPVEYLRIESIGKTGQSVNAEMF